MTKAQEKVLLELARSVQSLLPKSAQKKALREAQRKLFEEKGAKKVPS